jgi:hypothetical protein
MFTFFVNTHELAEIPFIISGFEDLSSASKKLFLVINISSLSFYVNYKRAPNPLNHFCHNTELLLV